MRYLVTGAAGFVGKKIMDMYPNAVAAPSLRNATLDQVKKMIEESDADVILHTAAISDIPTCQANPEASYIANVQLPVFLAKASGGRKLVCFSSDQVYSGSTEEGPYTEDMVQPGNLYAEHKWEMEQRVLDLDPNAVMLRAEWMYDFIAPRSNYFLNVLNAEKEISFSRQQFRGVTYVREVAEMMAKTALLPGGSYNFGSETTKSIYDVTEQFLQHLGKKVTLKESFKGHNLWIDGSKARKYGVVFSEVNKGLEKCLRDSCEVLA